MRVPWVELWQPVPALTVPLAAGFLLDPTGVFWRRTHAQHAVLRHIPACQNIFLLASQREAAPGWAVVGLFGHLGGLSPCSTQLVLVPIHSVAGLVADHCCPQVLEKTKQVIESHPNQPWVIMEMENGASAKVRESLISQQPFFCLRSSWVVSHPSGSWFSAAELSLLPVPEQGEGPLRYSLVSHLLD